MQQRKSVRLILVRHTQTALNAERRHTGVLDPPLNARGKAQLEALANRIRNLPITAVHSSNMRRTGEVARAIADVRELSVRYDPRLWEVDVGTLTGMTSDEIEIAHPDSVARIQAEEFDFTEFGGENYAQTVARQEECFKELLEEYGSANLLHASLNRVVVVGHGKSLGSMMRHLGERCALHEQGGFNDILYSE